MKNIARDNFIDRLFRGRPNLHNRQSSLLPAECKRYFYENSFLLQQKRHYSRLLLFFCCQMTKDFIYNISKSKNFFTVFVSG